MINFDDTEIAFKARSTYELQKARYLFRSFNVPSLVVAGPRLVTAALRLHLPVEGLIKHTIFDQFCGGTTLADCQKKVATLARYGVRSILDYSVEGLGQEADFDRTAGEVERAMSAGSHFAVFKMTGIGGVSLLEKASLGVALNQSERGALARLEARCYGLCRAASRVGVRILFDAEETWLQPAVDRMALAMMRELNRDRAVVYNTLQFYRHDRLAYLEELCGLGRDENFKVGIKLVRGAYMEKERRRAATRHVQSPIQPDKASTDRDFDRALIYLIGRLDDVAIFSGTHNERSNQLLTTLIAERGLPRNDPRIEFSQLLGMSDHLTYNLAHHGYNVSKYVPYGPVRAVLPYLFRRMEENSAMKGQVGRELELIERELQRRLIH